MTKASVQNSLTRHSKIRSIEDYRSVIGDEKVDRILAKGKKLKGMHITNVNSTGYGGGVAEILSSLIVLMNSMDVQVGWRQILGRSDFFEITKNMHNALQTGEMDLTAEKKQVYEEVVYENALRMHLDKHDLVVIHDPQPLPLIEHYKNRKGPWVWRCHIDLSNPHKELWHYLKTFVDQYDAMIASIEEYGKEVKPPIHYYMPAIDPFAFKNTELTDKEIDERLEAFGLPKDKPFFVQVSRFDVWKDPKGVIEAFKIAQKEIDATLVLIGNAATDDPEGQQVFESLQEMKDDDIILSQEGDDMVLINALQTRAAVVIQKSIREGFGLTVTEAMWKGKAVIGGNVGGIRYQIKDGENGYLVSSVDECAKRMIELVQDKELQKKIGKAAKESVREKFLLSRLLEQYFDLFIDLLKK